MLSHIHGDHVGGLASFLQQNSNVTVYVPSSFPQSLKDEIKLCGARLEEVHQARELFPGVFTTGELDGKIKEQSLVVITGCAHPGVVNIVQKGKEVGKDKIHLVLGGFHLGGVSVARIESVIDDLLSLGIERVAPCHCSGDLARSLFQKDFHQNYVESGVGQEISIP